MSNSKDVDGIELQYTRHPYPAPISDMRERIQLGYRQGSSPDQIWNKLFPEKAYKDDLNILIAGCGTNQAIYHALMFPNSHHYAIDVSRESLRHVADMIKAYDIKNLEIEKKYNRIKT
jgi:tRNA G46 methylase TrmB